jgi:hypothetical protein
MCVLVAALAAAGVTPGGPAATSPHGRAAAGDCSMATALQVGKPYSYDSKNTLTQVLCGPFTGAGSNAMAIAFFFPVCWPVQRWAVFSFTNGDWKLVLDVSDYLSKPLVALGSDIRETTAVHRLGDSRCNPTGGTRARIWHWNGTRLVAGAWKQVTGGQPSKHATFYWPGRKLHCEMTDDSANPNRPHVWCVTVSARHGVNLELSGKVTVCTGQGAGCLGTVPASSPTLAYGRQVTVGRFRCFSQRAGVKCIVIRSGKGFLFNGTSVRRVG